MCLILLGWKAHPRYRLIVAANRDELHARPAAPAGWWPDAPGLFAGRDLAAGGTWLGITRSGRFAALTNHRDLRRTPRTGESRGALVRDFLLGTEAPATYLASVSAQRARWLPFNLLAADAASCICLGSTAGPPFALAPGVYGLSNALLDTPWHKVEQGRTRLGALLSTAADDAFLTPDALVAALFALLADTSEASFDALPDTGLPLARERQVSASMIIDPVYGTRCTTVLLQDHAGGWQMVERSFDVDGHETSRQAAAHAAGRAHARLTRPPRPG